MMSARMVLDKVRTDGIAPTLEAVRNKLDQPLPMGEELQPGARATHSAGRSCCR
jgi:hypothetical protein